MARIVKGSWRHSGQTTGANFTVALPASGYAVNDLLICFLRNQGGGTTISTASTGWNILAGQSAVGSGRIAVAWKVATTTAETDPVFAGASNIWSGDVFVVKDAPAASPIDSDSRSTTTGAVLELAPAALTTLSDNCLVFHHIGGNSAAGQMRVPTDEVTAATTDLLRGDDSYQLIAYRQAGAAGVLSLPKVYSQISMATGMAYWMVAIKNKTGGQLQPFAKSGITDLAFYGPQGNGSPIQTITAQAGSVFAATINAITVSAVLPTITSPLDSLRWGGYHSSISTENSTEKWSGFYHAIVLPDLTGKIVSFEWQIGNAATAVQWANDGFIFGFTDGTNWVAYQVQPKGGWVVSIWARDYFEIGVTTPYASSGAINWAAVTGMVYLGHRAAGTAANTTFWVKHLVINGTAKIVGGGADDPTTFVDAQLAADACGYRNVIDLQGSAQIFSRNHVQIADGAIPTYFDSAAQAFELPLAYEYAVEKNRHWRISADIMQLSVKASAGDTINLASGAAVTTQEALLTIDAASDTGATYSFAGESFIGWLPTWKTGVPCASNTFKSCGTIDFKGADIVNVIANNGTDAALIAASDGFSATGCTLTASAAAVYGIRIAAPGTFSLDGTTFSGFTKDIDVTDALTNVNAGAFVVGRPYKIAVVGTTDFTLIGASANTIGVFFTATGVGAGTGNADEAVTINLAAGQAMPTYQTAGAPVNIVASPVFQSVTISGAVAGSRIQIYDTTSSTELYNGTPTFPHVWTDASPAAASRAIRLRVAYVSGVTAKEFIEGSIGTCGTTAGTEDVSYLVNQVNDTTYNANALDGSLVTGVTIDDTLDRVIINIAGGSVTWPQIYAYQVYWLGTAAGIIDDGAFIEAVDTANYLLTLFDIRNTNAVPLTITGGWGRDSTTLTIAGCIDYAGSTGNIYPMPDHVVAYATGSALTAGQAAQLSAVESASLNLDVAVSTLASAASLAATATKVTEMHELEGLDAAKPLVVDNDLNTRTAGAIVQNVNTVGNVTTVQRV